MPPSRHSSSSHSRSSSHSHSSRSHSSYSSRSSSRSYRSRDYDSYYSYDRNNSSGGLLPEGTGMVLGSYLIIFIAIVVLWGFKSMVSGIREGTTGVKQGTSNVEIYGRTLHLKSKGQGVYKVSKNSDDFDRKLVWNKEYESYYDEKSDCYVWYNTDEKPFVWQYWYEGISSDYGDSGWMEHEWDGWYIETKNNNWMKLPSKYDTSELWYIDD